MLQKYHQEGTSLVIHWLRLCMSTAGGMGSIPSHRIKILHPTCCMWFSQKKKKKKFKKVKDNLQNVRKYLQVIYLIWNLYSEYTKFSNKNFLIQEQEDKKPNF